MQAFMSYPSEQLSVARSVYEFLRSVDVDVWFDKESLVPGQDWDRERADAQARADLTVLICSPETFERDGVIQREVKNILDLLRDKPFGKIYLISIRTEEIGFPPELARYQWIDYFESNWSIRLARSVRYKYTELDITPPPKLEDLVRGTQIPDLTTKSFVDSTKVLEAEARFIQYQLGGDYWSYVNAEIMSIVFRSYYNFRYNNDELFFPTQKNEWRISATEFFRAGEIVSIFIFTYLFGSGAAHHSYRYTSLNFGGPEAGKLDLLNLFDINVYEEKDEMLEFLKGYCELDIKRQLLSTKANVDDFFGYPDREQSTWKTRLETSELFAQFNFDRTGLTFHFSPYDVLPFAFGGFEVHLPWSMVRSRLRPKFAAWFVPAVIERAESD